MEVSELEDYGICDICGLKTDPDTLVQHRHHTDPRCGKKKYSLSVERYYIHNIDGEQSSLQGPLEYAFARWCNIHGVLWNKPSYLPYTLNGKNKRYFPDFHLPSIDLYIETKGMYSDKDRRKMELVLAENDVEICMLFKHDFMKLHTELQTAEQLKEEFQYYEKEIAHLDDGC